MAPAVGIQFISRDPTRISHGGTLEVILEKNEKESLMTLVLYKVTKMLLVAR